MDELETFLAGGRVDAHHERPNNAERNQEMSNNEAALALIERAARVLSKNWSRMHTNESLGHQRMLATSLFDAGLLASFDGRPECHMPTSTDE